MKGKVKNLTSDFLIYGVIIKGSLQQIQQLKSFLEDNQFKIHYQRYSSGFLKIIDADARDDND